MSGLRLSLFVLMLCLLLVVTSLHRDVSHSINGDQEEGFILFTLYFLSKQGKCTQKNVLFVHKGTKRLEMAGKKEKKNSFEIVSFNFGCDVNI